MKNAAVSEERTTEELLGELLNYQKKAVRHTRIAALACILLTAVLLAAAILLLPRALTMSERMETALAEVDALALQAGELMDAADAFLGENREDLTEALRKVNEVDFDSLNEAIHKIRDIDFDSLDETIHKIRDIDFDSLNEAIGNLNEAVRPLAEFARRFS